VVPSLTPTCTMALLGSIEFRGVVDGGFGDFTFCRIKGKPCVVPLSQFGSSELSCLDIVPRRGGDVVISMFVPGRKEFIVPRIAYVAFRCHVPHADVVETTCSHV
jgi:hypothetical protein